MASTPTTTRRALALGGGAFASVGLIAGAAAVAGSVPLTPDAELTRLCAEFDLLERQTIEVLNGSTFMEDDDKADSVVQAIRERQEPLLDRICTLPCTTADGWAALAASLLLWEAGEVELEDDPDANMNERLLSALLRGVLGRRA